MNQPTEISSDDVACIILAAGQSVRFGSQKMMHPIANGKAMLLNTIELFQSMFDKVVVITNQEQVLIELVRASSASLIQNDKGHLGMSESLKLGIENTSPSRGWLIALGDMPYLNASTIYSIVESLKENRIVRPHYQGKAGNPVAFGLEFRSQLLEINGDQGAKQVVARNQAKLVDIEINDTGIWQDIDRPQDILPPA